MMVREPTRAQIEIETLVKVTDLLGLNSLIIHLFDYGAAPRRMISSAGTVGQFDNLAVVVCAGQFIGSGHPRDAGAEDDD